MTEPKQLQTQLYSRDVYIMVGYPGSGKTTWANELAGRLGLIRIDGDTYKTPEKMIAAAEAALPTAEKGFIFDSTGGTKARRAKFIEFAKRNKLFPRIVWIKTPIEVAMERNALRQKPVPKIAFWVYRKNFEEPTKYEVGHLVHVYPEN